MLFRAEYARPHHVLVLLLVTCLSTGCPDVPVTPDLGSDTTSVDGEVQIPLVLDRIVESAGFPEGGERVSIYGEGFLEGAQVWFGEIRGTSVLVMSPTQINVNVPAGEAGLIDVRVVLLDGRESTLPEAYLYRGPLELHEITPRASPSHVATEVTVTGAGFHEGVRILIGGRMLENVTYVDEETIRGTVPARLDGRARPVSVIASDRFEQRILPRAFRYEDALRVLWVSPQTGTIAGGTAVTLFGAGLTSGTQVFFGDTAAEILIDGNGHTLTVRVPPGSHGAVDLRVETALQEKTITEAYVYADEATLTGTLTLLGLWPGTGAAKGGAQVALAVYGLPQFASAQDLEVTFNGVKAEIVEVQPYTHQVIVKVPPGQPGLADVRVTAGSDASSRGDLFSYGPTLTATTLSPASGGTAGGTQILLAGDGLDGVTQVFFGNREAEIQGTAEDGAITVVSPPASPGMVDVWVIRGSDRVRVPVTFDYRSSRPSTFWGLSTADGSQAGGRLLRIYGEGFQGFEGPITLGKETLEAFTVVDDATITIRAITGEVGTVNLRSEDSGTLAMVYSLFDPTSKYGGTTGDTIPEALNVTVLEMSSRDPIPEAFVILWDDLGTPYQGLTDARGQITFSDAGFGPPQMVTAAKDSHTTSSVVEFDARNVTLFLYSFEPAPPGTPGPVEPTPVPDGGISGTVSGLDKYIILPPGECHEAPAGALCAPCNEDSDCEGAGAKCTNLGEQGKHCTTACTVPSDCPAGFSPRKLGKCAR